MTIRGEAQPPQNHRLPLSHTAMGMSLPEESRQHTRSANFLLSLLGWAPYNSRGLACNWTLHDVKGWLS